MESTDCPLIEQVAGKASGAPVLRGTRLRAEDITANAEMGVQWIATAFGVSAEKVRVVLEFWREHWSQLPIEYFSAEQVQAFGAGDIDWSDCADVTRSPALLSGEPTICGTNVRPIDLIGHREHGEHWLAEAYGLPAAAIRSVLGYFDRRHRQGHFATSL